MDTMNGVINIATCLLLRAGYCDFTLEPNFNPEIEAQYGDVPNPFYLFNDPFTPHSDTITHWNGTGWDEVPRIEI